MYIEQSEESIKRILAVIKLALLLCLALADMAQAAIEFADVTGGRLEGEVADGIASFRGVPFAAPPVGVRRWKAPQPVLSWSGTRNANRFAPACVQPRSADQPPISEDCLYLNVWTAAAATERRPAVSPLACWHGRFNDTPILVGFTSAEWGDPSPPNALEWLKDRIARLRANKLMRRWSAPIRLPITMKPGSQPGVSFATWPRAGPPGCGPGCSE
jgi:carboxylesterase family protein